MAKERYECEDITTEETNEIIQLYANAEYHLNDLKNEDDIQSVCNHISGYDFITDTYNDDVYTISIGTDNKEPNRLQGIRVYIDKTYKPLKLSRFIDVYFNDEEYPFEDYEVKTEHE